MTINWKVRIRNPLFWTALISAVLLLITRICAIFGIYIDTALLGEQLAGIVEVIFEILVILGVVVDPTTKGIRDSVLAMTYQFPKPWESEEG